ncbi:MAG TPA: sugar phosphate isomerase/epimerase [Acidimicrobiales bacterium]
MGGDFRLAGAPITWGVCEVPGWGEQLPADRVLGEMSSLGLVALEVGPVGYLGTSPEAIKTQAEAFGMCVVGGFVPLVLHRTDAWDETEKEAHSVAARYAAAGATNFITAVVKDSQWGNPEPLSEDEWQHMAWALSRVDAICSLYGMTQTVHPHVGTLVETNKDVEEVLGRTKVKFCLDTGHLSIGGIDCVAFVRQHHERIANVHLKDVHLEMSPAVLDRSLSLLDATRNGLFCCLGDGDIPIANIVRELQVHGYDGWYVLEQDTTINSPVDSDLPLEAAARSIAYLERELGIQIQAQESPHSDARKTPQIKKVTTK